MRLNVSVVVFTMVVADRRQRPKGSRWSMRSFSIEMSENQKLGTFWQYQRLQIYSKTLGNLFKFYREPWWRSTNCKLIYVCVKYSANKLNEN